jgi:chemotaxis protein CheD
MMQPATHSSIADLKRRASDIADGPAGPYAHLRKRNSVPLPGTAGNDGYFDKQLNTLVFKVMPGEFFVSRRNEMFTTVLGSCISACIRDTKVGIGGMNHFMLPEALNFDESFSRNGAASTANRYGAYAMENLINTILKYGGHRENLEVKIFGGGRIVPGMSDVGQRNIEFVRWFLAMEKLNIVAEQVGDTCPRRVNYFPRTGVVLVRRLRSLQATAIVQREQQYMTNIAATNSGGEIDLFD